MMKRLFSIFVLFGIVNSSFANNSLEYSIEKFLKKNWDIGKLKRFAENSGKHNFLQIYPNHQNLKYDVGEKAFFVLMIKGETSSSLLKIIPVGFFPNRNNPVEINKVGETYYYRTPKLLAHNENVFTGEAWLVYKEQYEKTTSYLRRLNPNWKIHKELIERLRQKLKQNHITLDIIDLALKVNNAPVFQSDQNFEVCKNEISTITLAKASDVDGDELTYSLVTEPSVGSLTKCLNNSNDLECEFTPPQGFTGEVEFTYKASDGIEDSENVSKVVISVTQVRVTDIAAGLLYSCALLSNGEVKCWGFNNYGQLGLGHTQYIGDNEVPADVASIFLGGKAIQISSGFFHTCALLENGNVKCWGRNDYGQLGLRHTNLIGDNELPGNVPDIKLGDRVIQISTGELHTCAILVGNRLKCWGYNFHGQLGLGHHLNVGDNEYPEDVPDVQVGGEIIQVAAGSNFTCALLVGGNLKCWGWNKGHHCVEIDGNSYCRSFNYGSLGMKDVGVINEPSDDFVNVDTEGRKVIQIAANLSNACALLEDGEMRCWGPSDTWKLGLGYPDILVVGDDENPSEVEVISIDEQGEKVRDISAGGGYHICVVLQNGKLKCWGYGAFGQLGQGYVKYIGDDEFPSSIGTIQLEADVQAVASGGHHTCALLVNDEVKCWGGNWRAQLGLGHKRSIFFPSTVGFVEIYREKKRTDYVTL